MRFTHWQIPVSGMNEAPLSRPSRRNRLAWTGCVIVCALTLAAVLAPWLAPYDPLEQDLSNRLDQPSWRHPLGSDELGRDILSRLLAGARVSMRVGAAVVLLSGTFGVLIG